MSKCAKRPLPSAPTVGVSSKHQLVNFYIVRLTWMVSFAVHRFVRPEHREINHSSAIWLFSFLLLLVFFVAQAGVSLLGEVN